MREIFERSKRPFEDRKGILLLVKYANKDYGVLDIYQYDRLTLEPVGKGQVSVDVTMRDATYFAAAQESSTWSEQYRQTVPYDRASKAKYLPFGWSSLDIVPTSNGSRFLVLKEVRSIGKALFTILNSAIAVICDSKEELEQQLEDVLPKIGGPDQDVASIKALILSRL